MTLDYRGKKPGRSAIGTVSSGAKRTRARSQHDWYVEPRWAVDALFDAVEFDGSIWDPACGAGNIVDAYRARAGFLYGHGSDVVFRGCDGAGVRDFLKDPAWVTGADIVCNPPFGLAEEFIARALELSRRKVAMLLRWSFAEGGTGKSTKQKLRAWCLDEAPLAHVLVFAPRVSMPPGGLGIEAKGGAVAFGWFVWDKQWAGPASFRRLWKPSELSAGARATLAKMPADFDPHAPIENLSELYRDAYALKKAVP